LSVALLEHVDSVEAPTETYKARLRGHAWKEYANALRFSGKLREALAAVLVAQRHYDVSSTCALDAEKAKLVEACIRADLGQHESALKLSRACAESFRKYDDAEYYVFARMGEAWVLFNTARTREALSIFSDMASEAEARGDRHTLARCLHNVGECARVLGDIPRARKLLARALQHYEDLDIRTEMPRVRWVRSAVAFLITVAVYFTRFGRICSTSSAKPS
jgi:tetratricopeptide (TPR) repeat protein